MTKKKKHEIKDYVDLVRLACNTGGRMKVEDFDKFCNRNDGRWLKKNKYIEFKEESAIGQYVEFTKRCYKWYKSYSEEKIYSRSSSNSHDIALSHKMSEYVDKGIMTVYDIYSPIEYLKKFDGGYGYENEHLGAPDVIVVSEEFGTFGFDLVTQNYTKADIQTKVDWCSMHSIGCVIDDIHYEKRSFSTFIF